MKKIILAVMFFVLSAKCFATTVDVDTFGEYNTSPYTNVIKVPSSQAASILNPSSYGPQSVYWYDRGNFPSGPSSLDTTRELITLISINSTPVTIGGLAYKLLTVTRGTPVREHKASKTNSIRFTTSLGTATHTRTPTATATSTTTATHTTTPTPTVTLTPTPIPRATVAPVFTTTPVAVYISNPGTTTTTNWNFQLQGADPWVTTGLPVYTPLNGGVTVWFPYPTIWGWTTDTR